MCEICGYKSKKKNATRTKKKYQQFKINQFEFFFLFATIRNLIYFSHLSAAICRHCFELFGMNFTISIKKQIQMKMEIYFQKKFK